MNFWKTYQWEIVLNALEVLLTESNCSMKILLSLKLFFPVISSFITTMNYFKVLHSKVGSVYFVLQMKKLRYIELACNPRISK